MADADPLTDRIHTALADGLTAGEIEPAPDGGMITGWLIVGQYVDADGDTGWFLRGMHDQGVIVSTGLVELVRECVRTDLLANVHDDD